MGNNSAMRSGANNRHRNGGIIKALAFAYLSILIIAMIVNGPTLPLYLAFAAIAALVILPNEFFGLALIILLTMLFERYFALQGLLVDSNVYKFYLIDLAICLSALAIFIRRRIQPGTDKFKFGLSEKLLLAWLALVAIYLVRGYFDINADFDLVFSSFKNYFFYPLLYLLAVFAINSADKFKNIIHLMLLGAIGIIGFLFFGLANGAGLWTEFTPLSTYGTRYLASTHAFYLSLSLVIALALLLHDRLRSKSFSLLILGLWLIGIAGSLMRHLWLATFAGLAALFVLLENDIKKAYAALAAKTGLFAAMAASIAILAVGLLYFQGSLDRIGENITMIQDRVATVADLESDSSAVWRQNIWQDAEKIWLTNPVFGVGFGHTMLVDSGTEQSFQQIRNIHNSPLAIAVQMGVLGISVFAAFIISAIAACWKNLNENETLKPYKIGILSAVIVFLAACFFQPYLETNMMGMWLWLLLGLAAAARPLKD